jgi:two-component system, OmpR family, sensor histidine kinase CpxA
MKVRRPLYLQTLGMLSLYLCILLGLVVILFNARFGLGLDSLVNSPAGDHLDTIADAISSELKAAPQKNWNDILKHYNDIYKAKFYVFEAMHGQVAGDPVQLPEALANRAMPSPFVGRGLHIAFDDHGGPPDMMDHHGFHPPGPLGPDSLDPSVFEHDIGPHVFLFRSQAVPRTQLPLHMPQQQTLSRSFHTLNPNDRIFAHGLAGPTMPPPPNPHMRFVARTENPNRIWIADSVFLPDANDPSFHLPGIVLASCENIWETKLLFDVSFLAAVLGSVLLLSFLFWLPFIYRITSALSQLTAATERIADGNFDARVPVHSQDEIGKLSESVNVMAAKLDDFVSGQKKFLGAISHELRTPIARLQMALALLEETAAQNQKPLVSDIREEIEEMKGLVDELLAFCKAGMQGQETKLVNVDLNLLINEVLNKEAPDCEVNSNIPAGLAVLGDQHLLDRSVSNVIRNSIRYGGTKGPIAIEAEQKENEVIVQISDNGPGVPEDAIRHLGEPFYRTEFSRSRISGGIGLGLAIVKSCIEACQGTVQFRNRDTGGLIVELRFKAATPVGSKAS